MCGFVGYFGKGSNFWWKKINEMSNLINHRGPDNKGFHYFSFEKCLNYPINEKNFIFKKEKLAGYLAFNRLSIQDLSEKANQPMVSRSHPVVIVFNGEIYNTNYLREILKGKGYKFNSTSDTEVLLFLYIEFGLDKTLDLIDGMYAFSIIDLRNSMLYIVRDHVGIKPLYYYFNNDNLIFSSELKTFKVLNNYKWKLNYKKISEQLLFRNIIGEETLIENVYQLKPGTYQAYNVSEDSINLKYERNHYTLPEFKTPISSKYNIEDLENKLKNAIKSQLISDVPLGTQLSGGIDSSLVTLLASREKNDIETFSINVDDINLSEEKYIKYVNQFINCKGNIYGIKDSEYIEKFDEVSYHLDHPIHHPNTVGLFFLAKYSSNKVKVLLSGEGADELFAGYSRYFRYSFGFELINKPLRLLNNFIPLKLPFNSLGKSYNKNINYLLSLSNGSKNNLNKLYKQFCFDEAIQNRLDLFLNINGNGFLEKILNYDFMYELPSLLIRQDKMTMAFSIENRVPFLSKDLISIVRENYSPKELINKKLNKKSFLKASNNTKFPLKNLSQKIFDKSFAFRDKNGFGFPINRLLNNSIMEEKFQDVYLDCLEKYLNIEKNQLKIMWERKDLYSNELFTLISISSWLKSFSI